MSLTSVLRVASRLASFPPQAAQPTLSDADGTFRAAKRELPTAVCVVTVGADGDRRGVTTTSVSVLSAEPPTLLICLRRDWPGAAVLGPHDAFAVSVLAADQREIAEQFAVDSGEGVDRAPDGRWLRLPSGVSCLADSIVAFDCEVEERFERHDRLIVVGRVQRVLSGCASSALINWRGNFDQVGWSVDEISRAIGLSPSVTC